MTDKVKYYSFWAAGRTDLPRAVIYTNIKIDAAKLSNQEIEELVEEISGWMPYECTDNCDYSSDNDSINSYLKNILTVNDENQPVIFQDPIGDRWDDEFANAMQEISLQLNGDKLIETSGKTLVVKGWKVISWDAEYSKQPGSRFSHEIVCDVIVWERTKKYKGKAIKATTRHGYKEYDRKSLQHR